MNMIVAYDIADPKRLAKIAKIMKDYGTRVQKSIFEATVKGHIIDEMRRRVEETIIPEEDGVKYFPLCAKCSDTVEVIGQGVFIDPDEEYYIC
jgi:CRISPR-associated protein Cas2